MNGLVVLYIISLMAWAIGWLPIWGGWFIIGPIIFIPCLIAFCFLMTGGLLATAAGFFGLAAIFEKISDKLAARSWKKAQLLREKERAEKNFNNLTGGRKW